MRKLALFVAIVVAVLSPGGIPAQGNTMMPTSIKLLQHDGSPLKGARVSAAGVPQVPQMSNASGVTVWNVASGSTYSFNVQFKVSPSSFSITQSFDVRLFVPGNTPEQTIRLPKLVTSKLPLESADDYGSNLLDVRWKWFFPTSIEVNGKPQPLDFGLGAANVLQISGTRGNKVATLQYFEPSPLRAAATSDIDGDLIPDNAFAIVSPYSSETYVLPSKSMESNPPRISLTKVPWVRAVTQNDGIDLSLMLGAEDITSKFPDGVFRAHEPSPELSWGWFGGGLKIVGGKAEYQWEQSAGAQSYVFSYSVNQVTIGISSVVEVEVMSAICWDNKKGLIKQFRTLGDCPSGWTTTASVRKLSEARYKSCTELNRVLVGGVGRTNAVNFGKRSFRGFLAHNPGYLKNKHLDTDRDGIACER